MGGRLSSILFFIVFAWMGGDDKCVCSGCVNMPQKSRCNFIIFMHIRVNILILFTVGGKDPPELKI